MQVKSIAECSKGSILQYFRPSLSYHLSLRLLFCLVFSGRFTQVLLYAYMYTKYMYLYSTHTKVRQRNGRFAGGPIVIQNCMLYNVKSLSRNRDM